MPTIDADGSLKKQHAVEMNKLSLNSSRATFPNPLDYCRGGILLSFSGATRVQMSELQPDQDLGSWVIYGNYCEEFPGSKFYEGLTELIGYPSMNSKFDVRVRGLLK